MIALFALQGFAWAAQPSHKLEWRLSVDGQPIGQRTLTVRYLEGEAGTNRILESYTDIDGKVGPVTVRYRQRLTAHVDAREPASFHSVVDNGGTKIEVQGRWTPTSWVVTTTANGRSRTSPFELTHINLSSADLLDPYTRRPLSHYVKAQARVLSTSSGEIASGEVESLGVSQWSAGGQAVQVSGYAWTSPEGRSEYYYSPDGFLVRYRTQLLGATIDAQLVGPVPDGIDDFPVGALTPAVEQVEVR
ncbi:MAG: DUF6134 family protein [Myxococcota bacterium]